MAFQKKAIILSAIIGLLIASSIIGALYMFASPKAPSIRGVAGAVTVAIASGTLEAAQTSQYDVTERAIEITVGKMSQLEYAISKRAEVQERNVEPSVDVVTLTVTFYLQTPRGETIKQAEFNLKGEGFKDFKLIIGPKEGLTENGEHVLKIQIHLKVTPPAGQAPKVEKTIMIERPFIVQADTSSLA